MHEYLENSEELRNHLIHRLDTLLGEMYVIVASPTEQQRLRGHCDELEMFLITLFDMTRKEIDLIEAKAWQERKYFVGKQELRSHLIHRLDALLGEMYVIVASPTEQQRLRGHCDELEMLLITLFDMTRKEIDLIEAKAWQERKYFVGKHGGYCLTHDGEENYRWLKDHERVDPDKLNFRLSDNGISDERAHQVEADFRKWISESGIEDAHWLRDAGVRLPRLSEDWDDGEDGAESNGDEA